MRHYQGNNMRLREFTLAVAIGGLVVPVSAWATNSPATVDVLVADGAKKAVLAKLRDPGSAVFDLHISRVSGSPMACGTVNSKNGYGGMAGRQRFISNGMTITVLESEVVAGGLSEVWAKVCRRIGQ